MMSDKINEKVSFKDVNFILKTEKLNPFVLHNSKKELHEEISLVIYYYNFY